MESETEFRYQGMVKVNGVLTVLGLLFVVGGFGYLFTEHAVPGVAGFIVSVGVLMGAIARGRERGEKLVEKREGEGTSAVLMFMAFLLFGPMLLGCAVWLTGAIQSGQTRGIVAGGIGTLLSGGVVFAIFAEIFAAIRKRGVERV